MYTAILNISLSLNSLSLNSCLISLQTIDLIV
nr:MAG TPA: hypothetical protein [Caudoviricetes sp.]